MTVRAAGGVVWRDGDQGLEVLVVHRPKYDDWSLPKGKHDESDGLDDAVCAQREVEEETGYRVTLGPALGTTEYVDGKGRDKVVQYFAMTEPEGEFAPNDEVDSVLWVSAAEARQQLSYEHDAVVVEAFA